MSYQTEDRLNLRIESLEGQLAELKQRLKEIEWEGKTGFENGLECCPSCYGLRDNDDNRKEAEWNNNECGCCFVVGHTPDCWLKLAIGE